MVLRLVSGPILEKSNKIGPLADRQKVLLTATLRVFFFSDFQLPGKRKIFKKFLGNSGKFAESRKFAELLGFGKLPKVFAGNCFELDYFDIFSDFQHFRFNFSILLCCFDKLTSSFSIFLTN